MESEASGEVLTKRNHKLLNIAKVCEVFAWIFLFITIFNSYFSYTNIIQNVETRSINDNGYNLTPKEYRLDHGYFRQIKTEPLVIFKIAVDILAVVLRGVLGFLVLYGVSYGLKMIVETEINYRLKLGENSNE